jgi:hypothetical protein
MNSITELSKREEYRVGVFENRMLRNIFEPKREEVTEGPRKMHNKWLDNLYA